MGELFTKSAPIIKREAHKKSAKRINKREAQKITPCGLRAAWVRYTRCGALSAGGGTLSDRSDKSDRSDRFGVPL